MKLRTKILTRPKENDAVNAAPGKPPAAAKRKAEAAPDSQTRPPQRPRRAAAAVAGSSQGAAAAAAGTSAAVQLPSGGSPADVAEGEAQAALLQLAALATGPNQGGQVEPRTAAPVPVAVPHHLSSLGEDGRWLAAMELSPLLDLQQLQTSLETPGMGWPAGTTQLQLPSVGHTPGPLTNTWVLHLGTPLSQHAGLPSPTFLDFGEPSVPPKQAQWRSFSAPTAPPNGSANASQSPAAPASTAPTAAPTAAMGSSPSTVPPPSSCSTRSQPTGSGTKWVPCSRPAPPARTSLIIPISLPFLSSPVATQAAAPASAPPVAAAAATATTAAATVPMTAPPAAAVAHADASATAPLQASASAAMQAPTAAVPAEALPPAAAALPAQQQLPPAGSQERSRRERRQRVQDSEYEWSDASGEGDDSDGEDMLSGSDSESERSVASTPTSGGSSSSSSTSSKPSAGTSTGSSSKAPGGSNSSSKTVRRTGVSKLQQQVQQGNMMRQIQGLLHLAAPQAAAALGLSTANFRALCRSVGIQRWPNRRPGSAGM